MYSNSSEMVLILYFLKVCVVLTKKKKSNACESESRSVVSDSLQPHGVYSPWNSPGQNTGVGPFSRGSSQPWD